MKLFKLLFIAICIGGAVGAIAYINRPTPNPEPEFDNPIANEWKEKIKKLCQVGKWSIEGFREIEQGINIDLQTEDSEKEILSSENAEALKTFLFASSCSCVQEGTDKLFKQTSYSDDKIKYYVEAVDFLKKQIDRFSNNSNLKEASELCEAYDKIKKLLTFGAQARYEHPIRPYTGGTAGDRQKTIKNMAYYKSHFSKNTKIREAVESLDSKMREAEQQYYNSLATCIIEHYKRTQDLPALLEDQMRFKEISTNESAKRKLDNFVNE